MTHPSITKIVFVAHELIPDPLGNNPPTPADLYDVTGKANPHTPVQVHDFKNHSLEGGAVSDPNGSYTARILVLPWQLGHRVNAVMVVGGVPSEPSPPRKLPAHP